MGAGAGARALPHDSLGGAHEMIPVPIGGSLLSNRQRRRIASSRKALASSAEPSLDATATVVERMQQAEQRARTKGPGLRHSHINSTENMRSEFLAASNNAAAAASVAVAGAGAGTGAVGSTLLAEVQGQEQEQQQQYGQEIDVVIDNAPTITTLTYDNDNPSDDLDPLNETAGATAAAAVTPTVADEAADGHPQEQRQKRVAREGERERQVHGKDSTSSGAVCEETVSSSTNDYPPSTMTIIG